ncbi:MAG: hypothetical protein ACI8VT_003173 [Saprospiraceae bacterium]|jgi:hypothetical protein
MKTQNYLKVIAALLLLIGLAWFGCEKENNDLVLKETNQTDNFEIPADVAAHFTTAQIDEFYKEIAKEKTIQPPGYDFVPITMKMENEFRYLYGDVGKGDRYSDTKGWVIGIQFEGYGKWKEMGAFRYLEKVTFLIDECNSEYPLIGSRGEGSIFIKRSPQAKSNAQSRENILTFDSKDRMKVGGVIKQKEDKARTVDDNARINRNTRYKSKLSFNGGYGIFDRAYGYATKIEFHDGNQPGICTAAILGYVFVKRTDSPNPVE